MRSSLLLLALCYPLSAAHASGPAARLQAALPALFPAGSVADTVWSGVAAARLDRPSAAAVALGLEAGDRILAVAGNALSAAIPASLPETTFTVARSFTGDVPQLPPAVVGRQVLEQFMALAPVEQVPMRLARMLANQQTLVTDGVGVVLVPEASNRDDAAWLRLANPLPAPSEAALLAVRQALLERVDLPSSGPETEAAAAARLLAAGEALEARERAVRAIMVPIAAPDARAHREEFDAALALYVRATHRLQEERREVLSPGPRFAFVLEPLFSAASEPFSQDVLFIVDGSNAFQIAGGLVTSLHGSPSGGVPVLRDLDLLVEYAYAGRDFSGPNGGDEVPPEALRTRLRTTEHRASLELMYRPRLRSRLRPHLRGGPALFHLSATALDENGVERERVGVTTLGWLAGGGLDVWQHRGSGLRVGLVGVYQMIVHEFCPDEAPGWEGASNIPQFRIDLMESRPQRQRCVTASNPYGFAYRFDLSAWQAGLTLTLPF